MASSSSGAGRPTNIYNGVPTTRTSPRWADPFGGDLQILLLRATEGNILPPNPFTVSKTIQGVIGKEFKDAKPQRDDKNRLQYALHLRDEKLVNLLLGTKSLVDKTPIEIIHHPTLNQRKCVVSCRDVMFMTEAELLTELSDQKIIGVKRILRFDPMKKERVPTPTLILTINGTVIPEVINFGFLRAPTRNFYPNPMQCFGCFSFGHTSKKCTKKIQLCRNCGVAHPELNTEDKEKIKNFVCNSPASCVNCKGNHASTSRKCPAWIAEDNITRVRIDQGVSYKEAKSIFENKNGPSYSSKLQERLEKIQNTGCTQCKCSCTQTKPAY